MRYEDYNLDVILANEDVLISRYLSGYVLNSKMAQGSQYLYWENYYSQSKLVSDIFTS